MLLTINFEKKEEGKRARSVSVRSFIGNPYFSNKTRNGGLYKIKNSDKNKEDYYEY